LGVVLSLATARTYARNAVWHDPARFFTAMAEDSPDSSRAHASHAAAIALLRQSIANWPGVPERHYNLANELVATNDLAAAAAEYQRAIALNPRSLPRSRTSATR
ncbi:MAG: hypothetical protein ABIR79_06910, partial [Candidatus Binatia bacterium]